MVERGRVTQSDESMRIECSARFHGDQVVQISIGREVVQTSYIQQTKQES